MSKKKYEIRFPKELKEFVIGYDELRIKDDINSGAFGAVKVGLFHKKRVAIKVMTTKEFTEGLARRYISEVCALYMCRHPFIVKLVGFTNKKPFTIVTELVSYSNLRKFLEEKTYKRQWTGTNLTKIAMGVASAIGYMHSIGLMHRDLKPENILLDDDLNPKICDFGLTREFDKPSYPTAHLGTRYWMAPEVIRGKSKYDNKCDVFSYAMILYQMLTKKLPYEDISASNVCNEIERGKRPDLPLDTPKGLRLLIKQCWDDNPVKRPSFDEIYERFCSLNAYFDNTNQRDIQDYSDWIAMKTLIPVPKPKIYQEANDSFEPKTHYSLISFETEKKDQTKKKKKDFDIKEKKKKTIQFEPFNIDSNQFYKPNRRDFDGTFYTEKNSIKFPKKSKDYKYTNDNYEDQSFKLHTKAFNSKLFDSERNAKQNYYKRNYTTSNMNRNSLNDDDSDNYLIISQENSYDENDSYIFDQKRKNYYQSYSGNKKRIVAPKYEENERKAAPSFHYQSSIRSRKEAPELATPSIHFDNDIDEEQEILQQEESFANLNSPYYSSKKTLNMSILKDTKHPLFPTELNKIDSQIPRSQAKTFLRIASEHLRANNDIKAMKEVLEKMVEVLENETSIKEFETIGFKTLLPYEENELIDPIMDVLYVVFSIKPQLFQHNFKQAMNRLILSRPEKSLILINLFCMKFDEIEYPWEITDLLIKKENVYYESDYGSQYISLLYYLLKNYPNFYQSRIDSIRPIFTHFLLSEDSKASKASYKSIINFYDKYYVLPFEKIINDLHHKTLWKFAVSLLLRVKKLPVVEEFVFSLVKLSRQSESASLLALKLLQKADICNQLAEATNWLLYELPTYEKTLSFFISILKFKTSKKLIMEASEIPQFFFNLVTTENVEIISTFPYIFNSINITKELVSSLKEIKFFITLFKVMINSSRTCKVASLETIAIICQQKYVKDTMKLIPILKEYVKDDEPSIARAAVKVIYSMSFYSKPLQIFSDEHIDVKLKKIFKNDQIAKKYINEIVEHIYEFNK